VPTPSSLIASVFDVRLGASPIPLWFGADPLHLLQSLPFTDPSPPTFLEAFLISAIPAGLLVPPLPISFYSGPAPGLCFLLFCRGRLSWVWSAAHPLDML